MGKPKGESKGLAYLRKVRPEAIDHLLAFFRESARHLDPKTRFLISIVTKVVSGSPRGVEQYVRRALAEGATPDEVIDAVLCAYPCAGLTRVVDAVDVILDMGLEGFPAPGSPLPAGAGSSGLADGAPPASAPAASASAQVSEARGKNPLSEVVLAQAPEGWFEAGTLDDLAGGRRLRVLAGRHDIALFQAGSEVHAVGNRCPHKGGSLAEGTISGDLVVCPLHSWRFSLRTGICPDKPGASVPAYEVRVDGGKVLLRLD